MAAVWKLSLIHICGTGDPTRYACKVEMVDSRDQVEIGDLLSLIHI